jgi:hypothetical protein
MKDKVGPTPTKGGTDKRRSAPERTADEVLSEAERKYREAVASTDEWLNRVVEAHTHVSACQRAYRRAKGLPEEMVDEMDILIELMKEVRAQHDAEEAEKKGDKKKGQVGRQSSKDKARPARTKGGTDKRRSAPERTADEVLSEARHNYREAVAFADKLRRRLDEAKAHLDACRKAYRRARGFPEKMMDETDLMLEMIEEVEAERAAEEAEKNRK